MKLKHLEAPKALHRRRALVVGLATMVGQTMVPVAAGDRWVERWVDLTEPLPADADTAAEASRRRARVEQQQRKIGKTLAALGAVELARIRHARNAIAVRLPASALDAVRALPGVRRLRPLQNLYPPEQAGSSTARDPSTR